MDDLSSESPTSEYFVYNRRYAPLFFAKPNKHEEKNWHYSMSNTTREYFKMARQYKITAQTPLSNGMTAGEYGMWLLLMNHKKRKKNTY